MIQLNKRRKGLFGSQPFNPEAMPAGVGEPMMGLQQPMPEQQTQQPQREKVSALGVFSDFLSGVAGGGANYANGLHARRSAQAEQIAAQQRAEAQRLVDREEFMFRKDYTRDNAAPKYNDTVADFEFIRDQIGDEAAQEFLKNKANPPQYRQGADGQFYRIDTGGQAPAPVNITEDMWNSGKPVGGASGNAGGGF